MGFIEWWIPSRVIIAGVSICVIGSLLMIGSGLLLGLGTREVESRVIDALIVSTDMDSTEFLEWQDNFYNEEDRIPAYRIFTFWNLTNPDQYLAGERPVFREVGPYFYRQRLIRLDVNFTDHNEKVAYRRQTQYYYEDQGEATNPFEDVVIALNPAYAGLVGLTGGETGLTLGLAPPTVEQYIDLFQNTYPGLVTALFFPTALSMALTSVVGQINATVQDETAARAEFFSVWANATSVPSEYAFFPPELLVSVTAPSNISESSANALFDMSSPLSLTNAAPESALAWFALSVNTNPISDPLFQQISQLYMLSEAQALALLQWRARYSTTLAPQLQAVYGVPVSDLGWAQWAQGTITPSLQTLLPTYNIPSIPEL